MPDGELPPPGDQQINELPLAGVLQHLGLILRPYTYQGTARQILRHLARDGYVLMHRDDL